MNNQDSVAILFVHGILGAPNHFEPFLPLVPSSLTVCSILLKGHGGSVKDFSRASMAKWKQQARDALEKLSKTNNRVIVVAHSMGTLFAIQEAIIGKVDELFLLNTPLKLHIRFRLFKTAWKVFKGNIKSDDKWALAAQRAYSIESDKHILRYLGWIPRYLELFAEISKTRKILHKLSTPSHIYLAAQDEMISPKCSELFKSNPCAEVKTLNTSGHFYYSPEDECLLKADFEKMIQRISNTRQNSDLS